MFAEPSENYWRDPSDGWASSCWSRCCSPKPMSAITLAQTEHHRNDRTFIPSLVPNHPARSLRISPSIKSELDMTDISQKKRKISLCVGCGCQIHDQYILRVAPDLEWHAACLKCANCQQYLDETNTCFVRDGKTYCKTDYLRLFGTKCDKCNDCFKKNDLVMRAKTKIYHMKCFTCDACQKSLKPGDEFALRQDGLFCKEDHEDRSSKSLNNENNNNNNNITNNNNNNSNSNSNSNGNTNRNSNSNSNSFHHHQNHNEGSNSDSSESGSNKYSNRETNRNGGSKTASDGKPTRVRTVLNEKQLHTLRNCYQANPRPDALMKEQLVEMTGLSPRVIRVWFQNKRCKDKKRALAMRQQQQQEKEGRKMPFNMQPLIASSPMRQESPIGMNPIEIQSYQVPWDSLKDYALHTDLDRLNTSAPHFQQIVNQMHGYDLHRPIGMPAHDVNHPPGPTAPGADMIHPDSTDSLVTYMESDESMQHDPGSP